MPATGIKKAFIAHKATAKQRGIPFLLSFAEWHDIWQASEKLDERGCTVGRYVMARLGDEGAYAVGNVKIVLASENNSEGHVGIRNPNAKLTPEIARDIRKQHVKGSRGQYSTSALARRYGVTPRTIRDIIKRIIWRGELP